MVQIKQNTALQGESIISAACSVGVMLCLVVTVLGIKFKWFKHRLTFTQTPSANTRETASSSAYTNDGNFMQGVFRCRDAESDEIERPKTLPPIRVRKTSSKTPRYSLPPPKKYNDAVSQEPPPPPPPPLPSITPPPIANVPKTRKPKTPQTKQRKPRPKSEANNTEAIATIEAVNNPKVTLNKKVNFGDDAVEEIPPKPDRGKHYEKLRTEKSSNLSTKQAPPRRPTGFVRPQIDDLNIPESHDIAERRPTGYVRPQSDDFSELDRSISVEHSENRIQTNSDNKIILKLDGFSDTEEKSESVFEKVKNIPKPEPRSTIPQQVGILGSNQNEDAWSAVQRHRNLTQEIAKHHIAVNMRAQIQNDEESLVLKNSSENEKPRTLRDMRKNQAQPSPKRERLVDGCNENEADA